ncbi:putative disease resistance protein At5g66910 [Bidens hawaiensis]|uniref:putative disease resistance protein At5g66910 n=1 Tax=Bidens hawaiensis TaxID=980011 RepID=UPI0040499098
MDFLVSESITKLSEAVVFVAKTTANFKPELTQLQQTLQTVTPIINDVVRLNHILDRPNHQSAMFLDEIQDAQQLVHKCLKIKRNLIKKFTHSLKLKDVNSKLLRFFQLQVQADQTRDIKQTLVEVSDVKQRMDSLSMDMKQIHQTLSTTSSFSSTRRDRLLGFDLVERSRLGWRVPVRPAGIVAFDQPLKKLKAKLLDDDLMDVNDEHESESSVVVVAAAGGCGKTTLATMLCYDPQIQEKFRESIFFVTVSETPNFMAIVNDLFNPNPSGQPIPFQSNEDAKNKLGNFLYENVSSPMLLVLDDVWSDTFIDNFPLNIKGCKILVTSRTTFSQFDVFQFDPLSEEDAKILFHCSAFSVGKKRPRPPVDDNLVNQMVKRCKKHPLTLRVVGSSLNGRDESAWRSMLKSLSQGSLVLDLNEEVRNHLERSFKTLDNEFKEYFMDFGLFPEDQRIPASALLDMWVHLYNHDHEGHDTFDKIVRLSFRNLVTLVASGVRKDSGATVNYCDKQFVTQHDLLRELAIHLSSKPEVPIAHRKRLIINAHGEHLSASILNVQEPMRACILSISTGELFSSRWCDLKVPEVEVMVLNIKSKTYTLPHFMKEMQKLNILNVTNYGLYPSYIESLHLLGCLSNLSRVRLERVVISSLNVNILALENLQKVSFIMCKIGNAFETKVGTNNNLKVWPKLVELEMDYCQDLVAFPGLLCDGVHLKTLSITNCNEMCEISEEIGKLTNLENLSLRSCTKLEKLPESITRLEKLSILDISDCLSLSELPAEMGKLVGLRAIYMKGCTGIYELPRSVGELSHTQVVCNEEIYYQWLEFDNVEAELVEEDRLETLMKII